MRRIKFSGVIRAALFFAILFSCFLALTRLMVRKESMERFQPYLDNAGEYDVLFIGNSHVVNDIFPFVLWRNYGIASYNFGGNGNTMPVTYWQMRLALSYAKPKLVVVDMNDIDLNDKVTGHSSNIHTTLDVFPISKLKYEALEDLMDIPGVYDFDGNEIMKMRWEYLFTLGKYHSRWSQINGNDFHPEYSKTKGAHVAIDVQGPIEYEITDEHMEESGWGFVYLRRIIEDCQAQGIGVLLVNLPYPADEKQQMSANTVYDLASQYGIEYINFVSMDQVVDYNVDLFDGNSHLNPSGANKVSDYLGKFIADHYGIPDRREEKAYQHWKEEYEAYLDLKVRYLKAQSTLQNALMLLHDEDYSLVCMMPAKSKWYADDLILTLIQNIGREHIYEKDMYSKWSELIFPLEQLDYAAMENAPYIYVLDRGLQKQFENCGADAFQEEFSFGKIEYNATEEESLLTVNGADGRIWNVKTDSETDGIDILVFDARTNKLVAEQKY